ncbi:glycosyltransferase [Occultella kanbiaonis]|uniref:glycosyltransferase n=1 Tax=Occultella kanbiaonis TaxID=2675754 RepID=UPI0012B885F7|nr:glycosyltransferase [Occultella kanbiaonis]
MSPLRLALVCLHTSPATEPGAGDAGGMNVVVWQQAQALAALGHRVDVITRRSDPGQPEQSTPSPHLTLRFLDAGPPEPLPKGAHEDVMAEFGAALGRLARPVGYDLIHSHHWFSGIAALSVARSLGVPHVQSFHSIAAPEATPLSAGERPESPGRLAGEAMLARESDLVVAISAAEARTVTERLGGEPGRVVIVGPGVDNNLFHPDLRHHEDAGAQHQEPGHLLVAGRLHPLKGIDLAIETLALLPEPRPLLVIAGDAASDTAAYAERLRALARDRGVAGLVQFAGAQHRADLASLMRTARAVLVVSHSETYGLVALEASASGVPVVAAAGAGGLAEAVVDGVTGLLVPTRDPGDWAVAVERILTEPGLGAGLGRAGRERALGLDWENSARDLLAAYVSASGRRPRS